MGSAAKDRLAYFVVFRRLLFSQLALLAKELGEKLAALIGQDARDDFATMIEPRVAEELIKRLNRAGFGVGRAVNNGRYPRLDDCSGAHRTRLERDVQHTITESPIIKCRSGLRDSQHFGVSGWVVKLFSLIASGGDHPFAMHDDCPDGNFAGGLRGGSVLQRLLHPKLVRFKVQCRFPIPRLKNSRHRDRVYLSVSWSTFSAPFSFVNFTSRNWAWVWKLQKPSGRDARTSVRSEIFLPVVSTSAICSSSSQH